MTVPPILLLDRDDFFGRDSGIAVERMRSQDDFFGRDSGFAVERIRSQLPHTLFFSVH
jgi:hypothetical protein